MVDPCKTAVLDDYVLNDLENTVKAPLKFETITDPTDDVSQTYGSQDGYSYCGPREIEITNVLTDYQKILAFDQSTNEVTFGTNDDADRGVYTIEMRAYLVNYPNVESFKTFTVTIDYCQVTEMIPNPVPTQNYDLYTPAIQFSTLDFIQVPDCGYTLLYDVQIKDTLTNTYSPLPAWILNPTDLSWEVFTDDPNNTGIYQISVIASTPIAF